MNLPNKLTLLRILLIPICLGLWAAGAYLGEGAHIGAAAVFILASVTDFLDGYIARKRNIVTTFGKFADPVADKVLVLTAMIFLCADGRLPAWAVAIVAARELLIDGLRLVTAGKGQVMAAGWLGKIKTNLQIYCVAAAMLLPGGQLWMDVLLWVLVIAMSAMTAVSGAQYLYSARGFLKDEEPPASGKSHS